MRPRATRRRTAGRHRTASGRTSRSVGLLRREEPDAAGADLPPDAALHVELAGGGEHAQVASPLPPSTWTPPAGPSPIAREAAELLGDDAGHAVGEPGERGDACCESSQATSSGVPETSASRSAGGSSCDRQAVGAALDRGGHEVRAPAVGEQRDDPGASPATPRSPRSTTPLQGTATCSARCRRARTTTSSSGDVGRHRPDDALAVDRRARRGPSRGSSEHRILARAHAPDARRRSHRGGLGARVRRAAPVGASATTCVGQARDRVDPLPRRREVAERRRRRRRPIADRRAGSSPAGSRAAAHRLVDAVRA